MEAFTTTLLADCSQALLCWSVSQVWLLQHRLLIPLHMYVYLNLPLSSRDEVQHVRGGGDGGTCTACGTSLLSKAQSQWCRPRLQRVLHRLCPSASDTLHRFLWRFLR